MCVCVCLFEGPPTHFAGPALTRKTHPGFQSSFPGPTNSGLLEASIGLIDSFQASLGFSNPLWFGSLTICGNFNTSSSCCLLLFLQRAFPCRMFKEDIYPRVPLRSALAFASGVPESARIGIAGESNIPQAPSTNPFFLEGLGFSSATF